MVGPGHLSHGGSLRDLGPQHWQDSQASKDVSQNCRGAVCLSLTTQEKARVLWHT